MPNPNIIRRIVSSLSRTISQSVIYFEDFQSGAVIVAPNYKFPTGWTLPGSPYTPTGEWVVYFDGGVLYPVSPTTGGKSLIMANNGFATEITTAKPFSTIGKTNITIDMLQYRTPLSPLLTLEWSSDNATWVNTSMTNVTANSTWASISTITLPSTAQNKATIYLRFSATADDGGAANEFLVIDDINVKGYS